MCVRAVDEWRGLGLAARGRRAALATVDEPGATGADAAASVARHMRTRAPSPSSRPSTPDEVDRLFLARRLAYPALERLGPVLTEDICVPRAAVPEMLARIRDAAAAHDVVIATIAHAGDGNLHPLIIAPEHDEAAKARAKTAFDRIVDGLPRARRHGHRRARRRTAEAPGARIELGERVLAMHRDIKAALDPRGTLNPGKAF